MDQRTAPEVWMVESAYWTLPITVEWRGDQTDTAAVRLGAHALPLLDSQRAALQSVIERIGTFSENRWWVLTFNLRTVARRLGPWLECDAEQHIRWAPLAETEAYRAYIEKQKAEGPADFPTERAWRQKNRAEFLVEFCRRCGLWHNPETVELVWVAFTQHCLDWLINDQRPVDLGFALLFPSPYHVMWKELILSSSSKSRVNSRKSLEEKNIIKRGLHRRMLDARLMAWNEQHTVAGWNLEVVPVYSWGIATSRAENLRARVRGEKYIEGVIDTLKRLLPQSITIYAKWIKKATSKSLRVHTNIAVKRAVALRLESQVSRRPHGPRGCTILPSHAVVSTAKGAKANLAPKDPGVPSVSNLQPQPEDLRHAGRDLAASDKGRTAGRLPVLDAVQSPVLVEPMLGERSDGRSE